MPSHRKGPALSSFWHEGSLYKAAILDSVFPPCNHCAHLGGRHACLDAVGDTVLFNPEDTRALPYVGKINGASHRSTGDPEDIQLSVTWFYRPEETAGGRREFHGCRELFSSDHQDTVHKNSIIGVCSVHTLKKYEALPTIGNLDYFARFSYKVSSKEFEPDRVPVYCVCEMPYNPDRPMIECSSCQDWFHIACVGDVVDPNQPYFCPECKGTVTTGRTAARSTAALGPSNRDMHGAGLTCHGPTGCPALVMASS